MSAVVEQSESNDLAVLERYLTTAINYVMRQGMTEMEIHQVVGKAIAARLVADAPGLVLPKPELLDKGIDDRRGKLGAE